MSTESLHVISRYPGKWAVRRTGASRAGRVFETRRDAVTYARALAQKEHGELVIHERDGMIREVQSFGANPASMVTTKK